jgi:hypothetical protein
MRVFKNLKELQPKRKTSTKFAKFVLKYLLEKSYEGETMSPRRAWFEKDDKRRKLIICFKSKAAKIAVHCLLRKLFLEAKGIYIGAYHHEIQ